jgi:predicted nucleic acid-binding protein
MVCMSDNILIDTNLLVYAYDRSEPEKQARALEVLDRLSRKNQGTLSTQVLSEFFVTVVYKLPAPLSIEQAIVRLQNYLISWKVLQVTGQVILEAARGVRDHQLNFWDSQIWATAHLNQIPVIFSEDFTNGRVIEGVRYINPFELNFSIENWA